MYAYEIRNTEISRYTKTIQIWDSNSAESTVSIWYTRVIYNETIKSEQYTVLSVLYGAKRNTW